MPVLLEPEPEPGRCDVLQTTSYIEIRYTKDSHPFV